MIRFALKAVFYLAAWCTFVMFCVMLPYACSSPQKQRNLSNAEGVCKEANRSYIASGACERCRVRKLPDGTVAYRIDYSGCSTNGLEHQQEQALEGK